MNTKGKKLLTIWVILIVVLAGVIAAYFLLKKKGAMPALLPEENSGDGSVAASDGVLKYGSRGDDVKRLQAYLNQQLAILVWRDMPVCDGKVITKLAEDGIFGKQTQAVVQWYFNSSTVNVNQIP